MSNEQQMIEVVADAIWNTGQEVLPSDADLKAKAAIEAMRPYLQPQWQPIETAPKDGTPCILMNDTFAWVGTYHQGHWAVCPHGYDCDAPWFDSGDERQNQNNKPPTRWMPLQKAAEPISRRHENGYNND